MIFDVYYPQRTKEGLMRPSVHPVPTDWNEIKKMMAHPKCLELIEKFRNGEKDAKAQLPAVCYVGACSKTRAAANMKPTQVVMIDVDHVEDPRGAYETIRAHAKEIMGGQWWIDNVLLWAITPSGKGLRGLIWAQAVLSEGNPSKIEDQMKFFNELFVLGDYGTFDAPCKDVSRLSFFFNPAEILYDSTQLYLDTTPKYPGDIIVNPTYDNDSTNQNASVTMTASVAAAPKVVDFTEEEKEKFDKFEYRGTPIRVIVEKYVEHFGEPSSGEKHAYYNEMVKNFRCICDNDKRLLLDILPRFGHTMEECESQIRSICKVNTLSTIPKAFYFFLKDYGFLKSRGETSYEGKMKEYMMSERDVTHSLPPYLPPVFKQLVGTAPADFIEPCINALLPILGTLTSYAEARYPYDDRIHTTSFFSVIYAPPGTGKGFVERFMDLLFHELKVRDYVQSERENIYLRFLNRKGSNDKSPDRPITSLRIIPPKNSEAEFLQKQRDNHGYHMFTYAAEMDSWAKGVKAAGGNKDDMVRIAWDNGGYGQQFKAANTFKGTVNLYWNVLITGTLQQVENYFKNVENGLVTRCCFTSIDNQEFAAPPKWKSLNAKQREFIREFAMRCDANTYKTPCDIAIGDLEGINDDDFDKEVDWQFKFKEKQTFDCSWIMPTIDKFHKEQMAKAALDVDKARDVFRRRVGVRGFRLALLCMCLWKNPRRSDLEKCIPFIKWWMERDLDNMLKLWGAKYNEQADVAPNLVQRTIYSNLPETFSKSDVYVLCTKQGIKTPVRQITYEWKKHNYIQQVDKDTFKKLKK